MLIMTTFQVLFNKMNLSFKLFGFRELFFFKKNFFFSWKKPSQSPLDKMKSQLCFQKKRYSKDTCVENVDPEWNAIFVIHKCINGHKPMTNLSFCIIAYLFYSGWKLTMLIILFVKKKLGLCSIYCLDEVFNVMYCSSI